MNNNIIEQFKLLVKQIEAEYLNAQVENDVKEMNMHKFRLQQIKRILSTLQRLDFEITDIDDIGEVPGFGKGTIRRIKEILETGKLSEIESKYNKKKQAKINSIQELEKIIGVGPKTAKKFVLEYKIRSVNDLKTAIKNGKIKVGDDILLGLKYYGIVQSGIPRKEVISVKKYLIKEAHKIDPKLEIMICGSFRRGKKFVGDIDVLMFHPEIINTKYVINPTKYDFKFYLEEFVNHLTAEGFLIDHMTHRNYKTKYMGFSKYNNNPIRRIDIRFFPYNSIYAAMLYFTGPYELNQIMRERAKKRNMILNEYGLYKIDEDENKIPLKITSEKDVFDYLGMEYLTPEEREAYSSGKITKNKT